MSRLSALCFLAADRTTAIGQMIDAYLKQNADIDDQSDDSLISGRTGDTAVSAMQSIT